MRAVRGGVDGAAARRARRGLGARPAMAWIPASETSEMWFAIRSSSDGAGLHPGITLALDWIGRVNKALPLDACDAQQHSFVAFRGAEHLGDQAGQICNPGPDTLLDDEIKRRRGVRHLPRHETVHPGFTSIADQVPQVHADVYSQFVFGGTCASRGHGGLGGVAHRRNRRADNFPVETELVAEVVVHRR